MISLFMKRDGRTLDRQTQEAIRLMAVERVREGESAAAVIEAYGFNRTTIYKWIKAALQPGVGIKALRSTKATGRPRSLTPTQERQVFRWINGRDPRQYGLDFGLWTRAVVVELIGKKFGVRLGLTAVGRAAGETRADTAEAVAASLSARSRSHRAVATGNLSGPSQTSPGARR